MKDEMTKKDFDVALIGCGAYGMPLAAHAKSMGKVGIQLAGWTQMLFGVYGERWVSQQSEYSRFINEYWIRPNESEKPSESKGVENGCYW
jgi:Cys-tRNA synthase (O-phospho-L-seryl-tRNA:Cys-tRNA synthase)